MDLFSSLKPYKKVFLLNAYMALFKLDFNNYTYIYIQIFYLIETKNRDINH